MVNNPTQKMAQQLVIKKKHYKIILVLFVAVNGWSLFKDYFISKSISEHTIPVTIIMVVSVLWVLMIIRNINKKLAAISYGPDGKLLMRGAFTSDEGAQP